MTESYRGPEEGRDLPLRLNVLRILHERWRFIVVAVLGVTGIVAIVGGLYLIWWQPVRQEWSLEFRPTFAGASEGTYPNGLVFSPTDITASPILDQVFTRNELQSYCGAEAFRSGFFVDQRTTQFAFLDLEYQARLSDARLNAVDRERIVAEYRAREAKMPINYRLVFFKPSTCEPVPAEVASKAVNDVLQVWAEDSESRRGVLNLQMQVLTPSSLDVGLAREESILIRVDLIRTALRRLESNVRMAEGMPGASVVRMGENRVTFAELRGKFRDLVQARLEPLVVRAGPVLGRDSVTWVSEALASAISEQKVAEGRARAYLETLREYSGVTSGAEVTGLEARQSPTASSDVQALTPQIDRTFIDRIIEMSAPNTIFRQDMARSIVRETVAAVEAGANVRHYERMAEAMRAAPSDGMSAAVVAERLDEIVAEGKRLAQQFNDLYGDFSRVSLRSAAMLYQVQKPVELKTLRNLSGRSYLLLVAGSFTLSLLLAFGAVLIRDRYIAARLQLPPSVSV